MYGNQEAIRIEGPKSDLWDRRTALAPAIRKNKELEEKQEQIEKALKEFALEEPKLAEILKRMGL